MAEIPKNIECNTPACETNHASQRGYFDTPAAAAPIELSREERNQLKKEIVDKRSRDVHIDYKNEEIRAAIIDNLRAKSEEILADNPSNRLDAERKTALKKFFEDFPVTMLYSAIAEGLTENQLYEVFSKTLHRIKDSSYDRSIFSTKFYNAKKYIAGMDFDDIKPSPALIILNRDKRLDVGNTITNDQRIELKNTILPNYTTEMVKAFINTLSDKNAYDTNRFSVLANLELDSLAEQLSDRSYVFNTAEDENTTQEQVINKFIDLAATRLASCVYNNDDKNKVVAAMQTAIDNME